MNPKSLKLLQSIKSALLPLHPLENKRIKSARKQLRLWWTVYEGNIEIVTLPVSRWQEYKKLRLRALQKEPNAFCSTYEREVAWSDEKWQQSLRDVADYKSWIFFAKIDGKPVGLIGGFRSDEDRKNHRVQIWGMYVDELYRRRGVAEALAKRLLREFSKNADIHVVRLEVNAEQKDAKRLYEHLGFKKAGTETVIFGDELTHEMVIMEKLLG